MAAIVTNHARGRIRERVGLPKRATTRNAEIALEKGLRREELTGELGKYIERLYLRYGTADNLRIFSRKIYLFRGNVLMTVMELPRTYWKASDCINEKKIRADLTDKNAAEKGG